MSKEREELPAGRDAGCLPSEPETKPAKKSAKKPTKSAPAEE